MTEDIQQLFIAAKKASDAIKTCPEDRKAAILDALAAKLITSSGAIIGQNRLDLEKMDDRDPKKDRLLLNETRIKDLAASTRAIAGLSDPSGQVLFRSATADGLEIVKQTVPLGVVGVIYESRPNVTVDVAALCIRSGNACILRGGSDALHTNTVLVGIIRSVLADFGVDDHAVQLFPADRSYMAELLAAVRYVDIIIPRGSQQLIDYVRQNARVPVIETGAGVCHTYVERTADLSKAVPIVVNAKVSRPSVCNALDTVIVDRAVAADFLPRLAAGLAPWDVEIFADEAAYRVLEPTGYARLEKAGAEDFGREFLDFKCSIKTVDGFDEALAHIAAHSSRHSEAIVSEDKALSEEFLAAVDAAAVYVNASTRFTDGGVFGLGAEIGISTQKLHARGPFALEKLVTEKWIVRGNGQVRG